MSDGKPFHSPFAALRTIAGLPPAEWSSVIIATGHARPGPEPPPRPAEAGTPIARAVVRMERSGRGGKEVTVVEQLTLPPAVLAEWLKALKATLGCGGSVEGDTLMLQGDHRKRLTAILISRGVKKVTIG